MLTPGQIEIMKNDENHDDTKRTSIELGYQFTIINDHDILFNIIVTHTGY